MNAVFVGIAVACVLLTIAVLLATRRAMLAAGRDITYGTAGEARRPPGYRPAHRHSRSITYIGQPAPTPTFADIAANNQDADVDSGTYANLYLVPEETR